jgi:fumarylacetoacetase
MTSIAHDQTTDPSLRSWVASANVTGADFPIQNLPFGVFRRAGSREAPRVGVAIGDAILDIAACLAAGLLDAASDDARSAALSCASPTLNALMARGADARRALREALSTLLAEQTPVHLRQTAEYALIPQASAELFMPVEIGDYTDFYASVHHATNVGAMFRPDNPLLPNYKWVPIGYHGRASSIVLSGTPIRRPSGQRKGPNDDTPAVGPSRSLDYELELGVFVGRGNPMGETIPLAAADEHLFGVCILNDWSARDIQAWEYQPLGPFLAKNFASSISPWVVTMEALAPFRAPIAARPDGDPAPLPYLDDATDRARGGFAITMEVALQTARMRTDGVAPERITRGSALDLYWTMGQMLTHHASNGCPMRTGDLLGSGTVSGASRDSSGCLLELTRRGAEPITLANGETRGFLEDGDEVIMTAFAERVGAVRIGLGSCRGRVAQATRNQDARD